MTGNLYICFEDIGSDVFTVFVRGDIIDPVEIWRGPGNMSGFCTFLMEQAARIAALEAQVAAAKAVQVTVKPLEFFLKGSGYCYAYPGGERPGNLGLLPAAIFAWVGDDKAYVSIGGEESPLPERFHHMRNGDDLCAYMQDLFSAEIAKVIEITPSPPPVDASPAPDLAATGSCGPNVTAQFNLAALARIAEIDADFSRAIGWGSWMVSAANEREGLVNRLNRKGHRIAHRYQAWTEGGAHVD